MEAFFLRKLYRFLIKATSKFKHKGDNSFFQ